MVITYLSSDLTMSVCGVDCGKAEASVMILSLTYLRGETFCHPRSENLTCNYRRWICTGALTLPFWLLNQNPRSMR